jgi:hypothetical protein
VLDSSSKFPADGILDASFLIQLGNYDECLAVKGPKQPDGTPSFLGRYCHYNIGFQGRQFERFDPVIDEIVQKQLQSERILVT